MPFPRPPCPIMIYCAQFICIGFRSRKRNVNNAFHLPLTSSETRAQLPVNNSKKAARSDVWGTSANKPSGFKCGLISGRTRVVDTRDFVPFVASIANILLRFVTDATIKIRITHRRWIFSKPSVTTIMAVIYLSMSYAVVTSSKAASSTCAVESPKAVA